MSLSRKAVLAVIALLIAIILVRGIFGPSYTPTGGQPEAETLFPQGQVQYQFGQASPQCQQPNCGNVDFSNFTVAPGSSGYVTGAYSSQYKMVMAILTPGQFTTFMHVNASSILSSDTYHYNESGIIDVQLPPGSYSLVFYYPGNLTDQLTITSPVSLSYAQPPTTSSPSTTVQPPSASAQVWDLTNDAGQVATVVVQPFTYSGSFSETSGSAGWWILDNQGNPMDRFNIGGNVAHDSPGDSWTFVNFATSGGGYQCMGTAEGTANGNFPYATSVSGTATWTCTSPLGTVTNTDSWTGTLVGTYKQ